MYPVLMAADILLFNAHKVPVGRDQVPAHRDGARLRPALQPSLSATTTFTLPEAVIEEHVATLPGLDGRKMSKSYDNTIPLFAPREQLKKLIAGIVTDSRAPGEAKEADNSNVFQLYQAFARPRKPRRCARHSPRASAGATRSRSCSSASMAKWRRCASTTRR
jgi:tryptophanyl-tRNA synthetase